MKRLCDETSELLRSSAAVPSFDAAVVSLFENGLVLLHFDFHNSSAQFITPNTALEAEATEVFIAVSAQTLSVEVRDDGCGITAADMARLFCRHHTAHTGTGHAGATLCNVAALARSVTITSRTSAAPATYTRSAHGGRVEPVVRSQTTRSAGTTVAVVALYDALPVRRKAAQPAQVLARTRTALAAAAVLAPRTALVLVDADTGTALLRLAPFPTPLPRFCALHGVDPASLVALPDPPPGTLAWRGWVAAPSRSPGHRDRSHQLLCLFWGFLDVLCSFLSHCGCVHKHAVLNKTLVRRSVFHEALEAACRVRPRHPAFLVQLTHNPATAEAVVEPADKSLVAFTATDAALSLLRDALTRALASSSLQLPPSNKNEDDEEEEEAGTQAIVVRGDSVTDLTGLGAACRPPLRRKAQSDPGTFAAMLEACLSGGGNDDNEDHGSHSDTETTHDSKGVKREPDEQKAAPQPLPVVTTATGDEEVCDPVDVLRYAEVGAPAACALRREDLRDVVVLGQLDAKYILARWRTLVLAFDQHAVHERVRLERLEDDVFGADGTQVRLGTATGRWLWSLSPADAAHLATYRAQVERWGFRWSPPVLSNGNSSKKVSALVTEVPVVAGVALDARALVAFLRALAASGGSAHTRPPAVSAILATRACRTAVRFGDPLPHAVCQRLLTALASCRLPFQCAHGRPSVHPLADISAIRAYARSVADSSCSCSTDT